MNAEMQTVFDKAKRYMYQNARPLNLMRWKYHFEHGSITEVLDALAAYQNPDGGFGHALEADSFNPNSSPIQTWCATEILYEIGYQEERHPVIQGILRYLDSGKDFSKGYWLASISSNNEYPHAPWWSYDSDDAIIANWKYNPTIALAGFILYYADVKSDVYQKAVTIAERAVADLFREGRAHNDGHEVRCFLRFCDYIGLAEEKKGKPLNKRFQTQKVRELCLEMANENICRDTTKWATCYVDRPSRYIESKADEMYEKLSELTDYECQFLREQQQADGSYEITWSWPEYPESWGVAKTWWKTEQTLLNLLYLKNMGEFEESGLPKTVELQPITRESWYECICLEVDPSQTNFVAKNAFSLAQAAYEPENCPFGIYANGEMVGFLMYNYDHDLKIWGLCRLMIDRRYQKHGYGEAAILKLLDLIREKYGPISFYVSYEPDNKVAERLYSKVGFEKTGDILCGEVLMVIQL